MKKVLMMIVLLALSSIATFAQKTGMTPVERKSMKQATAQRRAGTPVTLPAGVTPDEYTLRIINAISNGNNFDDVPREITTHVAFVGNDVYIAGLAYYFPDAYVKGTLSGTKVTFPTGQFVGQDQYGDEYLTGYILENNLPVLKDFVFDWNADTKTLTFDSSVYLAETSLPTTDGAVFALIKQAIYTYGALPPLVPVTVPEDIANSAVPYLLIADRMGYVANEQGGYDLVSEDYNLPVYIAISDNLEDIYIKGFVENVPEGWAKATKRADGKYVIPAGQYIGSVIDEEFGLNFNYFLTSYNRTNELIDIVLTLNEEDNSISSTMPVCVNQSKTNLQGYYFIMNWTMKEIQEQEATPADPKFTFYAEKSPYGSTVWYYTEMFIPLVDTEGRMMMSELLSYVFWKEKGGLQSPVTFKAGTGPGTYYKLKEDMTEFPYGFTDGLDISTHTVYFEKMGVDELKSWTKLGLQTIYRGGGVEHRSNIVWFDMEAYWKGTSGIEDVKSSKANENNVFYNLSGQRVDNPTKGLYIVNGRKVIVK